MGLRWWLALAVFVLLVGMFLLPRLISSRWVYQPMLERMRAGNFRFSVDAVDLHWFRPIRLQGITIAHSEPDQVGGLDRPPLIQVQQVGTDRGLWGYLFSGRELGRLEIEQPVVDFELLQEEGSLPELLRALGGEAGWSRARPGRRPPSVNVAVAIRGGRVVVRQAGRADPLVIVPAFELDVAYRASEEEAWLHIEPTRLLDRVALTPELMQLGLEFVVPVLARAAWLSGDISADIGAIDIPLARPVEAAGTAEVTFHSVRAGLNQPALEAGLRRIAILLGREPSNELILADGSVVEVTMAAGVIHHQGMKLGLPRVDPRLQMISEGNVSLVDRSLDLVLSIPVPIDLVARTETVRELGIPLVRLPIRGELGRPDLQWSQLRGDSAGVVAAIGGQLADDAPLTSAIIGALGGVAGGEADEAIRSTARALLELRQRLQQRRAAEQQIDKPPEGDEPMETDQPQVIPNDAAQGEARREDDPQASPPRRRPILDRLRSRGQGVEESP